MKTRLFCFLTITVTVATFAQSPDSIQAEAMRKLDRWIGQWEGEAWSSTTPGRRDTTLMNETIRKELDGTIIIIEGVGHRKMPNMQEGPIVHHAFAVISFDMKTKSYRWHAWRVPGGVHTETIPTITDRHFQWGMETPRGKMKYNGALNDKGQWQEVGEFSSDGQTWYAFFGMLLDKIH